MTPVLAALLISTAALAQTGTASEQKPDPAVPPAAQAPVTDAAAAPAPPAKPRTTARIQLIEQRMEAYDEFRALYETARFEEALPFAKRVVQLSEAHDDHDLELPIAYNNLGATQFQLGDYAAAEKSYKESLEILEATQGISSRRLIVPLSGLGAVYAALDQHALAVEQFDRALAVSRRSESLFNLAQLPLIEQAADSRFALGDFAGVERDYRYGLKIAEHHYGYDDPRTLPAVLRLASFYESVREFIAARMFYLRARDISMKESAGYTPLAIKSLVGIARSHRLQYTMAPESLESQLPARDEITGEVVGRVYRESRVPPPAADRAGLKSAQQALDLLRSTSDPPAQLLAETLTELGDWYQSTSRPQIALPYYTEASTLYTTAPDSGVANPLLAPRMIFYRAPLASTRGFNSPTGQYVVRKTVFTFMVAESGETRGITVVESDMSEGQLAQSRRALDRAIYCPRFEDGKPVATEGVRFTSEWYEQATAETPSTAES
jgi:tetratricopeptide (TPR) repeat protein